MPKIVSTALVEDSARWKKGFKTHIDIFKKQSINTIHFTANSNNEVAIVFDVSDIDKWREVLESEETVAAMKSDGLKKESIKFYVLDEELEI